MHLIVAYTFLNIYEKNYQFCQVLKETHTKEKWFLFSASRCICARYVCYVLWNLSCRIPIVSVHSDIAPTYYALQCLSSSLSSFYLPNNTTVCTFAWIRFYKSRTARSDKNTNSCPKQQQQQRPIKTVNGYIFYHTNKKNITNEKN